MNRLIKFSINEYKKLLIQTKTKVILVLFAIYAMVVGLAGFQITNKFGISIVSPEHMPIITLELIIGFALPLLAIFFGSEIAGEFKDGTIRNLFALPISKSKVYFGKNLAGAGIMATGLFVQGLTSLIISFATNGLGAFGEFGAIIIAYLGAFIFLITIQMISCMISVWIGSPSLAIVFNILLWLGMGVVGTFVTNVGSFLPTSFTVWYHPLINGLNIQMALPSLMYMIAYCVIFMITGLIIFERKEV